MNLEYKILHDHDLPLVFVGRSYHNNTLYRYWQQHRSCQHVTIEFLEQQSDSWFQQHQFMCAMSNVAFKKRIKEFLDSKSAPLFSVASGQSNIGYDVNIGGSTFINHNNNIYDCANIGSFVCVTNFVMISHEVVVGDLCHIAPYCYFSFTTTGVGNFVGMSNQFFGYPENKISTPAWCNFYANGRLTESVDTSGTWAGRKLVDSRTSLELAL